MRKTRLLLVALPFTLGLLACQPLEVTADPAGTQKLPLPGDTRVEGVITRDLRYRGDTLPKGTRVRVEETWILRHDPSASPPGYRINGLYDPTVRSDGLSLPKHSVDAFYLSAVLPEATQRVPVPAAAFSKAPSH